MENRLELVVNQKDFIYPLSSVYDLMIDPATSRASENSTRPFPVNPICSPAMTHDGCERSLDPFGRSRELNQSARSFLYKGLRCFFEVRIEGATQTLISSNQDQQVSFIAAQIEKRMMKVFVRSFRELTNHLDHLVSKWTSSDDSILCALELRRRNHFHGLSDLLRVLYRLYSSANVQEIRHRLILSCRLRCSTVVHLSWLRASFPTLFKVFEHLFEILLDLVRQSLLLC